MKCALCNNYKQLQLSHIIPKFVYDYIKKTGLLNTRFVMPLENDGKFYQDGDKEYLLCHDCEELFSASEKHFCENIFIPFKKDGFYKAINYNNSDYFCVASILWRILFCDIRDDNQNFNNEQMQHLRYYENIMKDFLIGNRTNLGTIKLYIYFFEVIESGESIKDLNIHQSIRRGTSGYTLVSDNVYLVFCNMAGIILIAILEDFKYKEKWQNCEIINGSAQLQPPQNTSSILWASLIEDIKEIEQKELSENQQTKIDKKILENKEAYLNSESFKEKINDINLKK
ncbi:MAG: hypothetical protein WCR54_08190 [Clostridia bacterium]